jgi:uncharacterized protein DUF4159
MTRAALVGTALVAALLYAEPARISQALAQGPALEDDRFAGLQWRFVRIRYQAFTVDNRYRQDYWGEPWAIDGPAAEENLTRRVRTATAIDVLEPIVMQLDNPKIWDQPWIYMVEPGNLRLRDEEVSTLRELLLRGGTLTVDDFHGPYEWDNLEKELKRVFPDRQIVEIEPPHPIYSCFYSLDGYPQVPGLGSFLAGRTWEKGGFVAHLRGVLDDSGRPMVLINWNTDMGDGVEWSNAEEYPGYVKYTAQAYRMLINEIVYSLTH